MNDDVLILLFARENRRQHDAIVIDARLGAENGDVVEVGLAREQFVEHTAGGHAVAENDEFASCRGRNLNHVPRTFRFDGPREYRCALSRAEAHNSSHVCSRSRVVELPMMFWETRRWVMPSTG